MYGLEEVKGESENKVSCFPQAVGIQPELMTLGLFQVTTCGVAIQ